MVLTSFGKFINSGILFAWMSFYFINLTDFFIVHLKGEAEEVAHG